MKKTIQLGSVFVSFFLVFSIRAEELPGCAVMTFEAKNGVSEAEASVLADGLESELIQLKQYRMVSRANLAKVLEAQKLSMVCSGTECAIEVGKVAALRYVVFGSIGKVGDTYSLVVNMADVETGVIEKTSKVTQAGKIDQLVVAGVGLAAKNLLTPDKGITSALKVSLSGSKQKMGDVLSLDLGGGEKMELVWIPAGTFNMGSTTEQRAWAAGPEGQGRIELFTDEGDQLRETKIAEGFWLGKVEVTVGQWKRFIANNPHYLSDAEKSGQAYCFDLKDGGNWKYMKGKSWRDPGFKQEDNHPVVCVSWNDAKAFCFWLNRDYVNQLSAGLTFRLPGEAEWEYACRGGRTDASAFWWGDSLAEGKGRLNAFGEDKLLRGAQSAICYPWKDGYCYTAPVGSFKELGENGYCLSDMLGNACEWCEDVYTGAGASEVIRTTGLDVHVLRGGWFFTPPGHLRCADRDWGTASAMVSSCGFRVFAGVPVQ